jgi:hypothetical protein
MGQFMVIQLICLLIILWPELVLWLPRALDERCPAGEFKLSASRRDLP